MKRVWRTGAAGPAAVMLAGSGTAREHGSGRADAARRAGANDERRSPSARTATDEKAGVRRLRSGAVDMLLAVLPGGRFWTGTAS